MEGNSSYKSIFKSTFLFGFVQVFNIIVKVGINKAVAVLLGTEGMGVIGLFQSTISVITTACGLGVSQSAVKDIAQGSNSSAKQFSIAISLTKKLVFCLGLFGALVTVALSPWLSEWTFGDGRYTYHFIALSFAVFFIIITEGQLAILKGARMLRLLAKSSLYGSFTGLFTAVPLYFWLREQGVIPSLIVSALTAMLFSAYFISKVKYEKQNYSVKSAFKNGSQMIKMGGALMYVSFLGVLSDYVIRAFISSVSDINTVGIFQAGAMIVTSYFGIVITALTTDYYPRVSAINSDNKALQVEFNKQSEVGLMMIGVMVVIFMFAMPLFIDILYTDSFLSVIPFLQYAVFGVLFTVCSNSLGIILLAKQASNLFFFTATIGRIITLSMSIIGFFYWGLAGLGVASAFFGVFHLVFMSFILYKKYGIRMNRRLLEMLIIVFVFSVCAFFIKEIELSIWKYSLGSVLLSCYLLYVMSRIEKIIGIDIISFIKNKFWR